jgi:hypothetical protein
LIMVESNIVVVVTVPFPPCCVDAKLFNIIISSRVSASVHNP